MSTTDARIYSPELRLQATHNGPLRGSESYQFGFYDAGILREAINELGPDASYQVWTLPIPTNDDEMLTALDLLNDEQIQYALVDKDKIVYVYVLGVDEARAGWMGIMNHLGYQVNSGPKTNKRTKSFHRPTLLNARFDHLNVVYVEPTAYSRYDFTNTTPGEDISDRFTDPDVVERLLDGGFVISRRLVQAAVQNLPAYDLGETSDPNDYYFDPRIRRQLVRELLEATALNARVIFEDGFLKGNAFVAELPEGVDIITSRTNIKKEITFHNGFMFIAEPQGPKSRVITDDQTVINFPKMFPVEDMDMWLTEEYAKMYDDAINDRLLTNWKQIYRRMWRDKDDLNDNEARARMAYVGYRWVSAGFKITHSPWLFETISLSNAKPLEKRVLIPCSVYEQIIPESLARMAGYEIELDEFEIVRVNELGCHVVNDLDWLEMYESHGGHDQDDFFKLFYRTMDGGDFDGEKVVIAIRSPNGYGEYSVFRYVENAWSPKWHKADGTEITFPVIDGTNWPERLSTAIFRNHVTYRGLPSKSEPALERTGPYTREDVIRDIKIAMAGGNVGGYVNACMIHAATLATHRPNQLCSLEDAIDKCINPDDAADVRAIDAEAKAMMREVIESGRTVDATLWTLRGSSRALMNHEVIELGDGIISQLYSLCEKHRSAYTAKIRAWSQANARPERIVHQLGQRLYYWSLPHLLNFRSSVWRSNASEETATSGRIVRNSWEDLYLNVVETIDSHERLQDKYDFVLALYSTSINVPTTGGKVTDQIVMNRFVYPWLEAALQYYGIAAIPTYDNRHGKVDIRVIRNNQWTWPNADGVITTYDDPLQFQAAHAEDSPICFTMAKESGERLVKSIF